MASVAKSPSRVPAPSGTTTDTNAIKCEPQLRNDSIHSGELLLAGEPSEVANVSDEEDIDDDEDEVDDGTEDDGNDDGDNLDVDDEEDDDDELPIDGEEDDVDDELTSDSFCSAYWWDGKHIKYIYARLGLTGMREYSPWTVCIHGSCISYIISAPTQPPLLDIQTGNKE
uniref:Uncharacterized protein n=1 Tax=Anopheles atroparvus TaxID=41427 RepID=A0A182J191_ANOAO